MDAQQISKYADAIMSEIRADVKAGTVPATVKSFSDLHSYVDANDYASQVIPQGDLTWDAWMELANDVETEVSRRLATGTAL